MSPVPIFPLPETVLFPSVPLSLHVFEPRYRQMTEDALAGEGLLAIVLLRPGWEKDYYDDPPVYDIATLGKIEHHAPLSEGRYNILLRGLSRVRLVVPGGSERPAGKLYRTRLAEPLPETSLEPGAAHIELSRRLEAMWRELEQKSGREGEESLIEPGQGSFEQIVNSIASLVDAPPERKQALLEEDDLLLRASRLEGFLADSLTFWRTLARFRALVPDDPRVN